MVASEEPDPAGSTAAPALAAVVAGDVAGGKRLVVVRHGRTAWNATGRHQGHADIDLDEVGREQVAQLAAWLAGSGMTADRLVTSDLQRARWTAEPLGRVLGLSPVADPRLREVDVGAWEGLTAEEAAQRFPEQYAAWRRGEDVARGGAGETRAAAGERAAAAIREHAAAVPPGGRLVVVSHGMVMGAALRRLREGQEIDLDEDPPHLDNGAWLEVWLGG